MAISVKGSGSGGLSSSDVTASSAQVVAGYTALTTDSNDEAILGTFEALSKTATANGVVLPDSGKYLDSVTVDIPIYDRSVITKLLTEEEMTAAGFSWE